MMIWYLGILYAIAQDFAEMEAERNQLRSEMERFQRQQLWKGLNKKYQLLLETVDKPTELLYEDHLMGAIAAQENQYFTLFTFLITSLCVGSWLYYLHFKYKETSYGLKEILYVVLFLTIFTRIWSSFNIYIESQYFIHGID